MFKYRVAQDFTDISSKAKAHYFRSLKQLMLPILVLVIFKDLNYLWDPYISHESTPSFSLSTLLYWLPGILQMAGMIYAVAACFCVADGVLLSRMISLKSAWMTAAKRLLHLYIICILMVAAVYLLGLFFYQLIGLITPYFPDYSQRVSIVLLVFLALSVVLFLNAYFFALPLALLKSTGVIKSFTRSMVLVRDNAIKTLCVYAMFSIFCVFFRQETRHAVTLSHYHANFAFDYIFILLIFPYVLNCILALFHQLLSLQDEVEQIKDD